LGRERAEVRALEAEKAARFLGVLIKVKDIYKQTYDKVHQPVLILANWKAEIASTAANSITNHKELLGVLGQSTRLRLKKAQQEICSPKPIWTLDQSWLEITKFKYNLNARILKLEKELDIE
ncbi:3565_t:CDS:2, partial [Paraglomus brasilianum]